MIQEDPMENHERDLYDLGLQADLAMLSRAPIDRRRLLRLGVAGIGQLLTGCASATAQGDSSPTFLPVVATSATEMTTPAATATTAPAECVSEIPQETAGPYPADGSNASGQSLNALALSGIVRQDIRTSLGTGNMVAGVPLTIELTLVDSSGDCAPLAGYAVYLWHCDRDGNYSMYSSGVTDEDYLRGVQAADSSGKLTFTSIFPGCYSGRWPHIHFEIYPSLALATGAANVVHTSQLALPEATCQEVYATDGYSSSVRNLAQISLASDNIFSDGADSQMATLSGDVTSGYVARLTVGVNV
jgi:protocatechuate 3,4-dioxygenase beta subunit